MSAELSVIAGMSIIAGHFTYFAFKFKDMDGVFWKPTSLFMFFMSLCFLDMIMFSVLKIAQNASLTYLQAGVLNTGILIMISATTLLAISLILGMLWMLLMGLKDWWKQYGGTYNG